MFSKDYKVNNESLSMITYCVLYFLEDISTSWKEKFVFIKVREFVLKLKANLQ